MRGSLTSGKTVDRIRELRRKGGTINEISSAVGIGKATVSRYIQGVDILPEYKDFLKSKQGGSKARSKKAWLNAESVAGKLLPERFDSVQKLIVLASLYWGEGTKRELNLSNTDPKMIKVFVSCLKELGVRREELRVSVRIYEDINKEDAISYWSRVLSVSPNKIISINILKGRKKGKLKYGMCRLRVTKGGNYHKMIISLVNVIARRAI